MSIIDNAKEIATLVQKLGDIELYRKIVELEGEIIELTRVNREQEENLTQLNQYKEVIETLNFDPPFYTAGNNRELYCARCIEADQKAIHLTINGEMKHRRRVWECPQCKSKFVDSRPT